MNDAGIDAYVQFESSESVSGSKFLQILLNAIRERYVIEFTYRKFNAKEAREYIAHPCLLKEYRSRWYLIAQIPGEPRHRTFGLERVENLEVRKEKYERDGSFDPRRLFKHSIGITELNEAPQTILIRFDKSQAPYIESNPLHSSQKIVERSETHTDIELFVQQTYELVNAILGFGHHAHVLQPASLRDQIIEENDRVRKLYK